MQSYSVREFAACELWPLVPGGSCKGEFDCSAGEPAIYLETAAKSVVLGLIYCW